MLRKLFETIASLKTPCSKKFIKYRRSRSQISFNVAVLKNIAMFTGKHLCWSPFLINLQS